MGPMCRWSSRSEVMARQIRPRPYLAIKLMASGVTFSAARVRSPSFSRSSSSTTTIICPARISSTAVRTSVNEVETDINPFKIVANNAPCAIARSSSSGGRDSITNFGPASGGCLFGVEFQLPNYQLTHLPNSLQQCCPDCNENKTSYQLSVVEHTIPLWQSHLPSPLKSAAPVAARC